MKTGIYFNAATCEITSVGPEDEHPGEPWRCVHEDHQLGLLTIRELLRDAHLVEEHRQAEITIGLEDVDEVMWDGPALGGRRFRRSDVQPRVDLPAVGTYDLASEPARRLQPERRLAHRRRSRDDERPALWEFVPVGGRQ